MRKNIVLFLVVSTLLIINYSIYKKEQLIVDGERVFIETVPVDPRSIMQGDYHILRYRFASAISADISRLKRKGFLVLQLNDKNVGTPVRVYKDTDSLKDNERIILYRIRSRKIRLGAESFFFQEGHGKYYTGARYGELRLAKNGHSLLIGLRDKDLKKLSAPK